MNKFALDSKFDQVPYRVIKEAHNTLKAYQSTHVRFENGQYTQGPHVGIKSRYAPDYRFIGTIHQADIYTATERIENYINEHHAFPPAYNGTRDYAMLKTMDDNTVYIENRCTRPVGKINADGNFELVGLETIDLDEAIRTLDPSFTKEAK